MGRLHRLTRGALWLDSWVREMYAFSIATAEAKMPIDLPPVPQAIMVQVGPPVCHQTDRQRVDW